MAAPGVSGMKSSEERNVTSFRKRGARGRAPAIPGTRAALHHGLLLGSCGVPGLDQVIGGGLAVGTLLLIEEDTYGTYSQMLLKYFLAEGVVNGHEVFAASASEDPKDILQDLPAPLTDEVKKQGGGQIAKNVSEMSEDSQDAMKIAWRYQNLPKLESVPMSSRFGHYYDVSKTMSPEMLQSTKTHSFYLPQEVSFDLKHSTSEMTPGYKQLLECIQRTIHQEGFDGSNPQKRQKNVLRIGIQSLGSVLWGDDICTSDRPQNQHGLTRFLYALRGLLRTSLSVCLITVPAHLIQNKAITMRVRSLSDTVVGLESFIGSEKETNPLYKDYHGLLHVHQIPRLNCLISDVSDTKDLAFKLKRKLFTIERLHLPPDLSDTVSRSSKQDLAGSTKLLSAGCGAVSAGQKHLDF
ncbi:elongator complex protein 4 isoform 2-T2 [Discoglossus pictus]